MDLYAVLGVERSDSDAKIRKAYRQAALRTHPDKIGGNLRAFQDVALAFEVLSCPTARHQYDSTFRQVARTKGVISKKAGKVSTSTYAKPPHPSTRKRPSSDLSSSSKRHRPSFNTVSSQILDRTTSSDFAVKTSKALSHLHEVLQALSPQSRLASIKSQLDENTRRALTTFIENSRNTDVTSSCDHSLSEKTSKGVVTTKNVQNYDQVPSSGFSGVRATSGAFYKAYVDIKGLRLYTRSYSAMDVAIDQHIMLVKLRHALRSATSRDQSMWETCEGASKIYQLCIDVFKSQGTSEYELGLSVIVSLRADRWLGRGHHITSAMMSLADALQAHARLLGARSASWMALRAEWVSLMLCKKRSLRNGLSLMEAQSKAEAARQVAAKHKLTRAIRRVIVALGEERQRTDRAEKYKSRKVALEERLKKISARKAMIARRHASKLRWQWMRRRDLTMEEMLWGAPRVPPKRECPVIV